MKTAGICLVAALTLAACGGGSSDRRSFAARSPSYAPQSASGPISQACLGGGRSSANSRLCGCIQAVANKSLTSTDQRLAGSFFNDPHRAQEVRQSDNWQHEVFWKRYIAFSEASASQCKGL